MSTNNNISESPIATDTQNAYSPDVDASRGDRGTFSTLTKEQEQFMTFVINYIYGQPTTKPRK